MSGRCEHGVPTTRTCAACFEYGLVFWAEERRRERRLAEVRALLRALLPAPSVVQDICCALYNSRHASPPLVAPAFDRQLGAALLSLLVGPFDLEAGAETIAAEIERAERRGYIRGGADERARATCHRTNQPRSALGPGEARCENEESDDEQG